MCGGGGRGDNGGQHNIKQSKLLIVKPICYLGK